MNDTAYAVSRQLPGYYIHGKQDIAIEISPKFSTVQRELGCHICSHYLCMGSYRPRGIYNIYSIIYTVEILNKIYYKLQMIPLHAGCIRCCNLYNTVFIIYILYT